MQKLIYLIAMLILGTGAASAQTVQKSKEDVNPAIAQPYDQQSIASADPREVATFLTALMADKLALTAEQFTKVKEINAARLAELQKHWLQNEGNNKGELKGLYKRYEEDMKAAITPKQYAKYEAFVAKYKE